MMISGAEVVATFENGAEEAADILVGADGIRSKVSAQAFGDPQLFHVGLRVWLSWCEDPGGLARDKGRICHPRDVQASFFPMLHEGRPGFERWIVEKSREGELPPADVESHLRKLLSDFHEPLPSFPDWTNFDTQSFCWEIYNRRSLNTWSEGRVASLGDAVHPVSPYAGYGMGMAIEDGYFLGRALGGCDLTASTRVAESFRSFETERVRYVNHHVEAARQLGDRFHYAPPLKARIRDFLFDHTRLLQKLISQAARSEAEKLSLQLKELHVA